ncbi:hypothetical protein J6P59_05415 [bacterium]|nr:hypothetical protein [bacterium]
MKQESDNNQLEKYFPSFNQQFESIESSEFKLKDIFNYELSEREKESLKL